MSRRGGWVMIDGQPVHVCGDVAKITDKDRAALTELVRAMRKQPACLHCLDTTVDPNNDAKPCPACRKPLAPTSSALVQRIRDQQRKP